MAFFHTAAIREDQDPVSSAQTDSISLQKKMEEIKGGVKGAPAPSFEFYKQQKFMEPNPMQLSKKEAAEPAGFEQVSEVDVKNDEDAPWDESLAPEKAVSEGETEDSWWNGDGSGTAKK